MLIRLFLTAALALGGCATSLAPVLMHGDADSVEIAYAGNLDATTPVARRHCAQYERVAQFLSATIDKAYFDCVRP
jgi:hypothetical protein